ncbi:MAG: ArnT family glycosyltransferase [bacterium]
MLWLAAGVCAAAEWLHARLQKSEDEETRQELESTLNPLFLRIGLGVLLLVYLLNGLTPETRHDPYDYHLTIPTLYLADGKIVEIPWHVFSYMPKNGEILYGLALGIGDDTLTKLIHFLFGGYCLLAAASFLHKIQGYEAALMAAFFIASLPVFGFLCTSSYIDLIRSFWELSALYLLYLVWEGRGAEGRSAHLVLSTLFAGMALGTKYVSWLVFFPGYAILLGLTLWTTGLIRSPRWLGLCALAGALPVAPWLATNAVWTGNPMYPLFPSLFGMHIPPAEEAYRFISEHQPDSYYRSAQNIIPYIFTRLGNLLIEGNALVLVGIAGWLTSFWWRFTSTGRRLISPAFWGLLGYTVLSSLLFFVEADNADGRFFFSTLVLLTIPSVFLLIALYHSIRSTSLLSLYFLPAITVFLLTNALIYRYHQILDLGESMLPILTQEQRDEWLSQRSVSYPVIQWAEKNLPPESLILGLGYPLRLKHIAKNKYGYIPFLEDLPDAAPASALAQRLRGAGVTHILKPYPILRQDIDLSILETEYLQQVYIHRGLTLYKLIGSV